jgi:hypothetical protein
LHWPLAVKNQKLLLLHQRLPLLHQHQHQLLLLS